MEQIFMSTDGRRVVVMDDGNNINLVFITNKRNIQWVGYRKDYHSGLCACECSNKICLVYISVANELIWDVLGNDNRIVLFSDIGNVWNIRDLRLIERLGMGVLVYRADNPVSKKSELFYMFPNLERKGKPLISEKDNIEAYNILSDGEKTILRYRISGEGEIKSYIMDFDASGEIYLEEKNKENINEYKEKIVGLERRHEEEIDSLKGMLKEMEEKYRKQYDELADFAGQLQQEGKRWRELYYKLSEQ